MGIKNKTKHSRKLVRSFLFLSRTCITQVWVSFMTPFRKQYEARRFSKYWCHKIAFKFTPSSGFAIAVRRRYNFHNPDGFLGKALVGRKNRTI